MPDNESLITYTGASVTQDESGGLQIAPTPAVPGFEDNNDNDIANLSTLTAALGP